MRDSAASGGEKLERLQKPAGDGRTPVHVGVIPDGNRRYARKNGMTDAEAHALGAKRVEDLLEWSLDLGIKYVTAYAFSTENFKRSDEEQEALMGIYSEKFRKIAHDERIHEKEVRVKTIGRKSQFPPKVRNAIREAEESTSDYDRFQLTIGIGYGGRAEIVDAAKELCRKVRDGEISVEEVDEEELTRAMYVPELPEPDLVIRTSGEKRLSGFLLWHARASKLYFTEKFWPEFERADLIGAIEAWRNSPCKGSDGVEL